MNAPTEPTQFDRSPEFFVAEVAHSWLSKLEPGENREIHVGAGRKIDPEKGILHEILEIRVSYQMEKVNDEPTSKLDPLPPVPQPATAFPQVPLAPVVVPPTS